MNSKNESLRRLFRLAAILTAVLMAVTVLSLLTTSLLVRLVSVHPENYMLTVVKVSNIVQYIVDYGLKIAVFAVMVAAAKHMPSQTRTNLLKIGGILGIVGNALMLLIILTGYVSDPHPAFEGWISLLEMFSGNPVMQVVLPHVTSIATVLCAVCFVFHASRTVNVTAVLRIVCVCLSLLMGVFGTAAVVGTLTKYILGLVGYGLSIAMYAVLTKYYGKQPTGEDVSVAVQNHEE